MQNKRAKSPEKRPQSSKRTHSAGGGGGKHEHHDHYDTSGRRLDHHYLETCEHCGKKDYFDLKSKARPRSEYR